MPISVEADALHTAAGMLPRAMAVKAMADCTVAGSVHRKSTPMYISGVTRGSSTGRSAQPSRGKSTKVAAKMVRCRRQWPMPAKMASRETRPRFAPDNFTLMLLSTVALASFLPASGAVSQWLEVATTLNYRFVQPGCKAPIGRHGH